MKSNYIMKTTLNTSAPQTALATSSVTAPRRGVKKPEAMSLVSTFAFPTTPFTIKEAVHAIGIDHWYVCEYIKKNAKIVGDAPKAKGSRGPAAKLYQLSK
jgi:hypothetical protein